MDGNDQQQSIKDIHSTTVKHRALHEEETLPQTVSIGSSSDERSIGNNSFRDFNKADLRCPVTGELSNVLDDYVVFPKVLGEGHYGCVRECIHRATRLTFACKSIDKTKIGRLDHLQREVELLSEMEHDGIMCLVDIYEDVDFVHIITEKYTGGELFDKIIDNTSESGCYSERKTASIMKSLLEAVAYLHDNGIVHRDIKPENILFEDSSEDAIRLIDFGLSRKHDKSKGPMSNPVGTAYYMAPELLKGRYDRSCDVWSLGTIAYILLCGYPPFNGETDPEIFETIQRGHYKFAGQAWEHKSDECKDFIKCLLRRDPRKRFTAREALEHPWIKNGGRKVRRQQQVQKKSSSSSSLRYLRIP